MNIIICKPNQPPYIKTINGKYDEMVNVVGSSLKPLSMNHDSIIIMCNESLYESEKDHWKHRMNIPGIFFFVGREKNRLRSLTVDEIEDIFDTIRREDLTVV
ncbi:DUF3846 domain-containing protein [Bacillus sp. Marseille-P3661]|uniref:DUF3846 domain-containing protein n=1 Tax=Bacillus sp. Marseille-P3661 TaxID=1936234 RepID=UPI000C82FD08|nr:hypothetical protein [Bacillus sp. Marseille-P3661]